MKLETSLADAAKCELAAEVVRRSGRLRLGVTGSSMLPAIRPGDVLAIERCTVHDTRPGEVVLFSREGRLFAHRLVSRSGECLITRGDSLPACDPAVTAAELLGKVTLVLRRGRPIGPGGNRGYLGRMSAALMRRWPSVTYAVERFPALAEYL